jgi:hypothetical protein
MKECVMKNTSIFKLFGIIALLMVIGFSFIGCVLPEEEGGNGGGTKEV